MEFGKDGVKNSFAMVTAINCALDIAKKKIELDQAKEILKRTQMENGAIENLINIQEKVIEQLLLSIGSHDRVVLLLFHHHH